MNDGHSADTTMERAQKVGNVLADLKVTHYPACDRPIELAAKKDTCDGCQRPFGTSQPGLSRHDRIEFLYYAFSGRLDEPNRVPHYLVARRLVLIR